MGNRVPLRSLSRKILEPAEVGDVLESLHDDHSVAIVGTAILDSILQQMIVHKLNDQNPRKIEKLFGDRGPMSDLSGKIMIAEAFQIISPVNAEYLHTIRRVRNAFAHSSIPLNFSMPEVQDATASLMKLLKQMKGVFDAMAKVAPPEWNLTEFDLNMRPRSAFRLIVQLLVITLDSAHRATGGNRLYKNTRTFDPARRSQRVDADKA